MNFEEFKEELTKEIGKELYERGVCDCELETTGQCLQVCCHL